MANGMYQVRVQDKVFGPFSLAQLAQLRDRGQLHPTYEVSQDGISWEPASMLPGMFAPDAPGTARPTSVDPSQWMMVGGEKKHSGLGITSFVMAMLMGVMFVACFCGAVYAVREAERVGRSLPDPSKDPVLLMAVLGIMAACLGDFVAVILGLIALFQSNRKKLFAVLGVIFGGLPLAAMALMFVIAAIRQQ
ncbi:MAG: hypothetical protein ACJ8C4_14565 [Gemmataceae bacterium]